MGSANNEIYRYKFAKRMLCWAQEDFVHSLGRIQLLFSLFKQIANNAN